MFWRQYGKKGHALNRRIMIFVHFQQVYLAWCIVQRDQKGEYGMGATQWSMKKGGDAP